MDLYILRLVELFEWATAYGFSGTAEAAKEMLKRERDENDQD